MAGTQALALSRGVSFTAAAHQLTLVVDPDDRLYDHRVLEPLSDEFVLSVANHGVLQTIRVQARGSENVVIIGKQRTKACLVIDHLCGAHTYRGKLQPVLDAIARLKDSDLGRRIVELVGVKGVRLPILALPPASGAAGAQRAMGVENAHRRGDTDIELARKAQRLEVLAVPREEIAADLGVTANKLGRLLKMDPDAAPKGKPGPKKGGLKRPTPKKIESVRATLEGHHGQDDLAAKAVLDWITGKMTDEELIEAFPWAAAAFEKKGKVAA